MTTPSQDHLDNEPSQQEKGDDELRGKIRSLVRAARQQHGLTQADLGRQVGASRFTINRIEAGATDLTPMLADQLELVLGLSELRSLVAQRDRSGSALVMGRDAVVARMLEGGQSSRVRVVLTDALDLYPMLYTWEREDSVLRGEDVEIVVPSARRVRELFGPDSGLQQRVDYQVKRILDLKKSDHYAADSLRVYESDDVITSMVLVNRHVDVEAAIWPPISVRGGMAEAEAALLPVGVTSEQHAVNQFEAHIDSLIAGRTPLRSNEALCRVDPDGDRPQVFTRYFTVGEDEEEDIDDSEGIAVVLVLVVALCPRKRYGVGRRVVTFMRSSSRQDHDRKRSLFSNTIEDLDIERAREAETGAPVGERRSTRGALASALDIDDFLETKGKVIPDLAYQVAAARELSMFGLDVDPTRFEPVVLPPEVRLVGKPSTNGRKRAAIAPRLFVLELKTQDPTPELATLQLNADVEEIGARDLLDDPNLNNFLAKSRDSGFLADVLTQRTIVDH